MTERAACDLSLERYLRADGGDPVVVAAKVDFLEGVVEAHRPLVEAGGKVFRVFEIDEHSDRCGARDRHNIVLE
jgi:hypothetical protein